MKRRLPLMVALLWSGSVLAQGTFTFSNRVLSVGLDAPMFNVGGTTKMAGPHMVAAVFLNGVQLGSPAPFRTGAGAGYWNPGADSVRVVAGKFSGDMVSGFNVLVWDFTKGTTLEASRNAGGDFGASSPFSITLGGAKTDPLLPPDLPGVMSNFRAFPMNVPEPSVVALVVMGAAVMLACRRRQQPLTSGSQPGGSL